MTRWTCEGRKRVVQYLRGLFHRLDVVGSRKTVDGQSHDAIEGAHPQVVVGIFLKLCRGVYQVRRMLTVIARGISCEHEFLTATSHSAILCVGHNSCDKTVDGLGR